MKIKYEKNFDDNLRPAFDDGAKFFLEKKKTATEGRSPALQRC